MTDKKLTVPVIYSLIPTDKNGMVLLNVPVKNAPLIASFNAFDGVMCPRSLPGRRGFTGAEEGAGGQTDGAARMLPQTSAGGGY